MTDAKKPTRGRINRRAFLRGAAGVSVALPFLEGLPERSAWAQDAKPIFSLFIVAANGVVPAKFLPSETGPLTETDLAASGTAVSQLSRHTENLLFVKGIRWPMSATTCSHAQGCVMSLTARATQGSSNQSTSTGPSADIVIAEKVQPGTEPLTLYAGNRKNGYIAERVSFAEAGKVRTADDNPYNLYTKLVGLAGNDGSMTPEAQAMAERLLASRISVHDVVRADLKELLRHPRLSSNDLTRLDQHLTYLRDAEMSMGGMGSEGMLACKIAGLDTTALDAFQSGFVFKMDGMIEQVAELHMSLVAMAFACNQNRTATLQWGDGTDMTRYDVPSNATLNWPFHYLSHRTQSSSAVGNSELAEQAHAEIDAVRMQTFAAGLDHFADRGLAEHCVVLWTNHLADGPSHTFINIPTLIWGSGGGYLKQAEYVDATQTFNNRLLNTLISAAVQDTGTVVEDFGDGDPGQLDAILA